VFFAGCGAGRTGDSAACGIERLLDHLALMSADRSGQRDEIQRRRLRFNTERTVVDVEGVAISKGHGPFDDLLAFRAKLMAAVSRPKSS
jgi:hypothetical protein